MLRIHGYTLGLRAATRAEGLAILQRVASFPGGDAVAESNIGQVHMFGGRARDLKEALAAYNRSLKLAPQGHRTHSLKIDLLLRFAGDLTAARQAVREVPEAAMREDRVMSAAVLVLLATAEPEEALRTLRSAYPYVNTATFTGPTSYLKGLAHRQANRPSAATTEWNVALKGIQRRLDANPTARTELVLKAATLAHLGRDAEAAEALQLYEQLVPPNSRDSQRVLIVKTLLGRIPEVVTALEGRLSAATGAFVLFNPELAALRTNPAYGALAEKARAVFADAQLK
jgi:tetratricopeptide (TPR) repeat protein